MPLLRGCGQGELHDVPAFAFARHFFEAGFSEHRHKAHETIAWRFGVHRVRLDDSGPKSVGTAHGFGQQLFGDGRSSEPACYEEACYRPDAVVWRIGADQAAMCTSWCDGAPCDRLSLEVTQDAYGCSAANTVCHCALSARAVFPLRLLGCRPPDHALAGLRAAFRFEQRLKICPSLDCDRAKDQGRRNGLGCHMKPWAAPLAPLQAVHAHAHLRTVSTVRVVMSLPKVRSSRDMNTGPLGLGR
jgi:hypothetical protein